MLQNSFQEQLEDCPVIAAARDREGLARCCQSESGIVFILFGDVCTISEIVDRVKSAGKLAFVHMDLVNGLSSREISVDYIRKETNADGIISTKQPQIRRGKELGLYTVHRFFVIDSAAYENVEKCTKAIRPDCVELMPGVMPKVIRQMAETLSVPVIAGGLISAFIIVCLRVGLGQRNVHAQVILLIIGVLLICAVALPNIIENVKRAVKK